MPWWAGGLIGIGVGVVITVGWFYWVFTDRGRNLGP
jgi:hypothetical protein